jgi:hypothetical protein
VSLRNIPITFGFASIAISQLVLGMWMITIAVEKGGKAKSLYHKNRLIKSRPYSLLRDFSYSSSGAPTDTR